MREKKTINDYSARIIAGILVIFLGCVVLSFVMQNVGYEMLGTEHQAEEGKPEETIDWKTQYPFSDDAEEAAKEKPGGPTLVDRYLSAVETIQSKLDWYVNETVPCKMELEKLSRRFKEWVGFSLQTSEDRDDNIYMKNGYLTYVQPKVPEEEIEEIADSLADFDQYLKEREIPFLYVNTGSKVCPTDREINVEAIEYTNENGDALQDALEKRNVDFLDIRAEMLAEGLDWYGAYYVTDHHWTTKTGLWAAEKIAEELNEKYGYSFDTSLLELPQYRQITYDNFFLGSHGRKDAYLKTDLEGYTLLLPQFKTDFTVTIPTREVSLRGEYEKTMVELDLLEKIKTYSREDHLTQPDAYNCSRLRNDALAVIENHLPTNNEGKKILFIRDSFGWYVTSFLAADIPRTEILYPETFDGSVRAYIDENKPDMVVMIYCERQIGKMDWTTHTNMFDMR